MYSLDIILSSNYTPTRAAGAHVDPADRTARGSATDRANADPAGNIASTRTLTTLIRAHVRARSASAMDRATAQRLN
jgi:hypothetical protein